jgi:hypothetical protein
LLKVVLQSSIKGRERGHWSGWSRSTRSSGWIRNTLLRDGRTTCVAWLIALLDRLPLANLLLAKLLLAEAACS